VIWIPVAAWIVAVAVAAVVLGFAAYEIWWKAGRLRGDLRRLTALGEELTAVQRDLVAARQRLTDGSSHAPPG
jgi:hypothetical protein